MRKAPASWARGFFILLVRGDPSYKLRASRVGFAAAIGPFYGQCPRLRRISAGVIGLTSASAVPLCECGGALMKYWIGDLLDWMFLVDEDDRRRQRGLASVC